MWPLCVVGVVRAVCVGKFREKKIQGKHGTLAFGTKGQIKI